MTNKLLETFVREILLEQSAYPTEWYHSSKFAGLTSAKEFSEKIMFLTDSLVVAKEYTRKLPGLQAGKKPVGTDYVEQPTIYRCSLNFETEKIFNYNLPEHQDLWNLLKKQSHQEDPEDPMLRTDLETVYPAKGSKISGTFPQWGKVRSLLRSLDPYGFIAAFVAEGGAQGASLAIKNPQYNVTINGSFTP